MSCSQLFLPLSPALSPPDFWFSFLSAHLTIHIQHQPPQLCLDHSLSYHDLIFFVPAAAAAAAAKLLQSCPTLHDPIDSSPPGSPIPGILQARTLEWVAISFFQLGSLKSCFARPSSSLIWRVFCDEKIMCLGSLPSCMTLSEW